VRVSSEYSSRFALISHALFGCASRRRVRRVWRLRRIEHGRRLCCGDGRRLRTTCDGQRLWGTFDGRRLRTTCDGRRLWGTFVTGKTHI
jgi:hypothetical protein